MKQRNGHDVPMPTGAELDILQVLWRDGPSTVRQVHETLYKHEGAGYTTALKLLQVMHAKHLVERDDGQRAHVYRAVGSRSSTQGRFVSDMVQRVFGGSAPQLVMQALGQGRSATREELAEIRAMLDRLEGEPT